MQFSFDNFILAEELFAIALQNLVACVLANNNLCLKLFSSLKSLTTFTVFYSVYVFFIPYSILRLQCYIESFYIDFTLKQNKLWNTFKIVSQFLAKNLKWFPSFLQ